MGDGSSREFLAVYAISTDDNRDGVAKANEPRRHVRDVNLCAADCVGASDTIKDPQFVVTGCGGAVENCLLFMKPPTRRRHEVLHSKRSCLCSYSEKLCGAH